MLTTSYPKKLSNNHTLWKIDPISVQYLTLFPVLGMNTH